MYLRREGWSDCPLPCKYTTTSTTTASTTLIPCQDASHGSRCFHAVEWAMKTGIHQNPEWYEGLTKSSSFQDFQLSLHKKKEASCALPCMSTPAPAAQATPAPTPQTTLLTPECSDAEKGSACYESVHWIMTKGLSKHPVWFRGLKPSSTFEEVQFYLHREGADDCPLPCPKVGGANASTPTKEGCASYGCVAYTPSNACQCNGGCVAHGSCCSDYKAFCAMPLTTPRPTPRKESCAVYGCVAYTASNLCQCNAECGSYANCCNDYRAICQNVGGASAPHSAPRPTPTKPSCAGYGCVAYTPSNACQCNAECGTYGSCCSDHEAVCTKAGGPSTSKLLKILKRMLDVFGS